MSLSLFQQLLNPFDDEEIQSSSERTDYAYYLQQQQRLYCHRIRRKKDLFEEHIKNYEFLNQLDSYLESQLFNNNTCNHMPNSISSTKVKFIEPFPENYENDEYAIVFKKNCVELREYSQFTIENMLRKRNLQTKPPSTNYSLVSPTKREHSVLLENEAIRQQFEFLKQEMIQYLLIPNPPHHLKEKLLHFLLDYQYQKLPNNVNIPEKEEQPSPPATTSSLKQPIAQATKTVLKQSQPQQTSQLYLEEENEKSWKKATLQMTYSNSNKKKKNTSDKESKSSAITTPVFQEQEEQNLLYPSPFSNTSSTNSNYAQWLLLEQPRNSLASFVGEE